MVLSERNYVSIYDIILKSKKKKQQQNNKKLIKTTNNIKKPITQNTKSK